ncbi:potassium transporter TrkG [Erysipelothrix piscisicarius]|uniref:potassium transporter TrkG n=1 Tax=Erysipelothrix piscisicarius TaxID=2485784 RepID=UPI002F923818
MQNLLIISLMAITPRTAGYANVNYATVSSMGIFVTILLMFIGASAGSTGGGVKVTTVVTIVLFVRAKLRDEQTHFKNRSISHEKVEKALLIVFAGIIMVLLASLILLITETIPERYGIEYVLVEVFSCFWNCGSNHGPHTKSYSDW